MSITQVKQMSAAPAVAFVADRNELFVGGGLLGSAYIAFLFAAAFHPHELDPNNHPLSFAQYAHATGWTADHLTFFVYWAMTIAGVLILLDVLRLTATAHRMIARIGVISAGAALALSALRFVVDGVVLKRAVDAWASAPATEQAARFASAETVRWMEEAAISYQGFVFGLALIALATLIVWTARIARPIGFVVGLSGLAYLVVGWIVGEAGLAPQGALPTYIAQITLPIAGVYLLVVAWRMPRPAVGRGGNGYAAELAAQEG